MADARISYRGMGEVRPVYEGGAPVVGDDEASLQKNRRVRFLIVRRFGPDDPLPAYPDAQILPWSGEVVPVVSPAPPPEPEAADPFEMADELELEPE